MSISIHDEATIEALSSLSIPEDVCTADGRFLGRFIPAVLSTMTYPEFNKTDEELAREDADPNTIWYTAEEVMQRLQSLSKDD